MPNLTAELKEKLKGSQKVVVLGIGSELRGDDSAGILVAKKLEKENLSGIIVLIGGTAPENLTGELKRLQPSHLIIVDAADMKEAPGTIRLVDPEEVGGFSFSTHSLPIKVLINYLQEHFHFQVLLIGIQPKNISFGNPLSPEIEDAAETAAQMIAACFN